ncbi:MAG TPA: GNAT family N-acetyltransferase, partial [Acidimicrobiales bacterium]|nr:GNAT family N-acetyltransferase [Acidimicrobiales bacterium]
LAGMVDPAARRRGIGTALLGRALQLAAERGIDEALLVVARTTGAGAAFARSLGGQLEHSEHSLVLHEAPRAAARLPGVVVRPAGTEDPDRVSSLLIEGFGDDLGSPVTNDPSQRQLVVEHGARVVGALRVNVDSDDHGTRAGIYGFVVAAAERGRGIGREVLRQVCTGLFDEGCTAVSLEVAVDNDHALGLYASVGFVRRATEDYYSMSTRSEIDPSAPA